MYYLETEEEIKNSKKPAWYTEEELEKMIETGELWDTFWLIYRR